MLDSFLDSQFAGNRRVTLGSLIFKIRPGEIVPRGSLVVAGYGDRRIRLKFLDRDAAHKNFSEPIVPNDFAEESKVTSNYLHWYLSRPEVAEFLIANASGSVFVRVPRTVLHAIPVPLPTNIARMTLTSDFAVMKTDNPFSKVIADLYNDFLLNATHHRYRTAVVLAGAICEIILYQLLIEQGVNPKLLKDDRALGMNKLLDYVRVLKLEQMPGFPLSQLEQVRKNRNDAIHAGLLVRKGRDLAAEDLEPFNPIIKYFGL